MYKAQVRVLGQWINIKLYAALHYRLSEYCYGWVYSTLADAQGVLRKLARDIIRAKRKTKTVDTGDMKDDLFLDSL